MKNRKSVLCLEVQRSSALDMLDYLSVEIRRFLNLGNNHFDEDRIFEALCTLR